MINDEAEWHTQFLLTIDYLTALNFYNGSTDQTLIT